MSNDNDFRNNHYVPVWYQKRFLDDTAADKSFYRLDLNPAVHRDSSGHIHSENAVRKLGPGKCFCELDLYTTKFGNEISTEIEQRFFGPVDRSGPTLVDYFAQFEHPKYVNEHFHNMLRMLSLQKLRTPKGLLQLADFTKVRRLNDLLFAMQELQNLFCAHWTEAVWEIVTAPPESDGFIISDNPVTVYNQACFPGSPVCKGHRDPDIWQTGTHTIFPLSRYYALIFTNLSWVRNPFSDPAKNRPNANPMRTAMFDWRGIHVGRLLSREDVLSINFIIKTRAYRYIASPVQAALYPERELKSKHWSLVGKNWLLMPDPRSMNFSTSLVIGYKDGGGSAFDEYGHRPWQKDYSNKTREAKEWDTFHKFQGMFAAKFGPRRRSQSFELDRLSPIEDDPDYHQYHLSFLQKKKRQDK